MFSKYYVNVVRRAISRLNLVQNKQTKKDSSLCEIDYTFISKTFIDVYYERLRTPPANNNRLFSRVADQSRFELVATVIAPRPFYKIHHLGNHANKWMNQLKPLTLSWDNVVNGTQSKWLFLLFNYLCTLSFLQNFSFDKQDRSNPTFSTLFGNWRVMFHIFEGFRPNIILFFTSSATTFYSSSSSSSLILLLPLLLVVILVVSPSPQFYCWPPSSPQWIVLITSTFPAPPEFYCLPPPHVSPTPHSPSPPLSSQLCFLLPLPPPSQFCSLPPRSPSPSSRNTCMNENGG